MNNTIPIVKQQSKNYNSHFAPIAPAIAPRPVHVLPKPIQGQISKPNTSTGSASSSNKVPPAPMIITSKHWVLPPRPKSGRKPSAASLEKKKQQAAQQAQHAKNIENKTNVPEKQSSKTNQTNQARDVDAKQPDQQVSSQKVGKIESMEHVGPKAEDAQEVKSSSHSTEQHGTQLPQPQSQLEPDLAITDTSASVTSNASVTNLSNNMVNLNLNKSQSENFVLNLKPHEVLKSQLETATEENHKLKSIISRLKVEIDQLQQRRSYSVPSIPVTASGIALSPQESTPVSTTATTTRDVSPSTIDPKDIGMAKPKKRTYKKKKKKKQDDVAAVTTATATTAASGTTLAADSVKVKMESPSPLPVTLSTSAVVPSDLPSIEPILDRQPAKKTKLTNTTLERSASLSLDMMSPPTSVMLDRSMSTPSDWSHIQQNGTHKVLSRTTTNTTFDPLEFTWPEYGCGFCNEGIEGACLCAEKGIIDDVKRDMMIRDIESNVINEGDEVENFLKTEEFLKVENDDGYSDFLMI